jgi:hypothetical protein
MSAIHSGQQNVSFTFVESQDILYLTALPTYEADE